MQDLVDRLLVRPSLQSARMAGAAVRGVYHRAPQDTMAGLASWSAHPNTFVRIASGVAYGMVGQRDRNALTEILPYVERLADDGDSEVREHGAEAALEHLWLAHADALWTIVEDWIDGKNDRVRQVVARSVARIATSGKIGRPSLLKRFIERGLALYDLMVPSASPVVVAAMATSLDAMGCMAPELVTPFVREWAAREEPGALALVMEVSRTPFGALCEGVDIDDVASRLARLHRASEREAAQLVSRGDGQIAYQQIVASSFLVPQASTHLPWAWIADPYRGCQLRCEFCNARAAGEWAGDETSGFVRRVTVVQNAASLLADELAEARLQPRDENVIAIGVTSDPYQPAEERFETTRDLLKACLSGGHPVVLQTRQELILRDSDVLELLARERLVNVYISMQSAVEGIRNKVELGTSTTAERFRTMRMLSAKGIPVGLLLSPIMPEITDDEGLLDETLRRATDAGASWVTAEVLNLHGSARAKVRHFLEGFVPTLVDGYRDIYTAAPRIGDADPEIETRIVEELVPELARRHGLTDTSRMLTGGRDAALCLIRR